MRVPIIAGNWKMHKTIAESIEFVNRVKPFIDSAEVEVVLCTPYTSLMSVKKMIEGTHLKLAAQNMHWEEQGAYTGEISPLMLKEIGIDYCIIGHSEQRQYFNETDETVNKKIHAAIKHGIQPIVCVGETAEQRESGKTNEVIRRQVIKALKNIEIFQLVNIVWAYEPIWAIGTGQTATPQQANEVIHYIRERIKELYHEQVSEEIRIQYGGSVKASNIAAIMEQKDIDGALVGGASLKDEEFIKIVNF
jgi:triosephosphate isomerase